MSATKNSTNTVYAQLMARLGPQSVVDMAHSMGVTADLNPVCAVVLGGGEVSVMDMAAGYSTLANQGIAKSPIVVTRVEFPDGRVKTYTPDQKEVLTRTEAARVTYALQQVIDGGTGKAAAFGRPAAGKTGTTQNNADAWFVGYTPKLTAAVWMGYPDKLTPMESVHGIQVQGGTFPAEMWRKFMQARHGRLRHRRLRRVRRRGDRRRRDARPQLRHVRRDQHGRPRRRRHPDHPTADPDHAAADADHGSVHVGTRHHGPGHYRTAGHDCSSRNNGAPRHHRAPSRSGRAGNQAARHRQPLTHTLWMERVSTGSRPDDGLARFAR